MAAGQHKLSRRALLAGACAALPLSRHPGLDPGSSWLGAVAVEDWTPDQVRGDDVRVKAWTKALARLTRAQSEIEALAHTGDERLYDRAVDRQIAALSRVLKAPAPDLAAVAAKLDLIERHAAWELRCGGAALICCGRMCGG